MATLKEKIFYINNGFKNGEIAIDGNSSLLFLNSILDEISADQNNFNEFEKDIPSLYKACIKELENSPQETKTILLKNILKNSGINSSIKSELITNKPIFKDFLESKSPNEIYKNVDVLYNFAVDERYKRIEIDALISTADIALSKNPNNSILSTYIENDEFKEEKLTKVMAATIVLKDLNENYDYKLTENQKEILTDTVIKINEAKSQNKEFSETLDKEINHYKEFMFFNSLNIEAQLHEIKQESELDGSGGFISSHPISDSLNEALRNKEKRDNSEIDVTSIEWEKKYRDYLNSLNNVKIMSSSDKFKARFASHGFAPATASLFGDSIVMCDKFGDPQKNLWNVSGLTGTMRLSRDVDYSDPRVTEQTFAIAALNARRNKWPTVYLNHPGPDGEAKHFLEASITAMVEIGNYNFDEIQVPRKFQHVLDHIKNNYTFIEAGNNVENNINNKSESSPQLKEIVFNELEEKNITIPNESKDQKNEILENGTDLSGFDKDNAIFENIDLDNNKDLNLDLNNQDLDSNNLNVDYIGNEDYSAPELGDMDFSGIDFGDESDNEAKKDFNLGDLNLDDSSLEILKNNSTNDNNKTEEKPTEKKNIRLFKNQ